MFDSRVRWADRLRLRTNRIGGHKVKQKRFFGCGILVVAFALAIPAPVSAGGTSICSSGSDMTGTTCGLAMTKSGPQIAHVGDTITYSYSVTSTGANAPTVDKTTGVVDDKCAPVTYGSGETNDDGKVDTRETWMFKRKDTVKAADVAAQSKVVNPATVTGTVCNNGNKETVTATATWTTHIVTPGITVTKSAAESSVTQGGTINYTITVNNTGTADLTLTPQDAGCTGFDATPFTLAVGASKTLTCSHVTTASDGSQYT